MGAPPVRPEVLAAWPDRTGPAVAGFLYVAAGVAFAAFVSGQDWTGMIPNEVRLAMVAFWLTFALVGGAAALVRGLWRGDVTVGTDGISIGLGPPRFISFGDVDRVERDRSARGQKHHLAVVVLRSGARIAVGARTELVDPATLTAVGEAQGELDEALERYRTHPPADHAASLARGARADAEWLEELRRRTQPGGFRAAKLAAPDLVAVVEDPTADPTARAGAAYALRAGGFADDTRDRVRAAADATAAPNVRVALEAIVDEAEGDEQVSAAVARVGARG